MARQYENFDVVFEADGPSYRATFTSLEGQPSVTLAFPLEEHELEAFLGLFGKHQRRRMESPELARATGVGRRLFDELFDDELRTRFLQAINDAKRERKGMRIRLDLSDADDLITLPWEYLYRIEGDDFVALSNYTPVVRHLKVGEPLPPAPLDGPLRVLVMISDPIERRGTLDVEREWQQLSASLRDEVDRGDVVLTRLPDGRLESLQTELQVNDYHVFHFIGHGEFSEVHDDGVLVMEDARARETHVPGRLLGDYLRDCLTMRLVVLNNCEGAATSETDPFAGSAQSLLRKGLPAVVAMQFEITDQAAIDFARGFYVGLMNGFPVEGALAEARKTMRRGPTIIEFGSPVLYMSTDDGAVFEKEEIATLPDETDDEPVHVESESEEIVAEVDEILDEMPSPEPIVVTPEVTAPAVDSGAPVEALRGADTPLATDPTPSTRIDTTAPTEVAPPVRPGPAETGDEDPWWKRPWIIGTGGLVGLALVASIVGNLVGPNTDTTTTTVLNTTTTIDGGLIVPGVNPVLQAGPDGFASFVDSPITVDGRDDDWTSPFLFESNELVFDPEGLFAGAGDLASTWRIAWDESSLYLFASVSDDVASQTQSGAALFAGDALGIYFDPDVSNNAPGGQLSQGEHVGIFLGRNGESVVLFPSASGGGFDADGALINPSDIDHVVIETATGYDVEVRIAWEALNVSPDQVTPGSVFRMTRDVSDSDVVGAASQQQKMISNSPNRTAAQQAMPEAWADLTLLEPGSASIPSNLFGSDGGDSGGLADGGTGTDSTVSLPSGTTLVDAASGRFRFGLDSNFIVADLTPGSVASNLDAIDFGLAQNVRDLAAVQGSAIQIAAFDELDLFDLFATNVTATEFDRQGFEPSQYLFEAEAFALQQGGSLLGWEFVANTGDQWIVAEFVGPTFLRDGSAGFVTAYYLYAFTSSSIIELALTTDNPVAYLPVFETIVATFELTG